VAAADAGQADTAVAALEPGAVVGSGAQRSRSRSAAPAAQQTAKPQDPERQGKVASGQDGDVEITFATNSSYFPPGTARRLGALLDGMASDQRYQVELRVGVSGADKVVGATTPEEARRYNQWLAERRVGRVQEWLAEHAQDRQLEIEPIFSANDSSRRVLVRVVPVT
jgi:outer membrane protein OmpA-like peptidoglycan-associated protein